MDGRKRGLWRVTAAIVASAASALVFALPSGAAPQPSSGNDTCGYPNSTFTENTVMRWAQINGQGTSAQVAAYANDEKGLLLGVNGATPLSSAPSNGTNSHHASNASGGSLTATDPSGRVYYPALYITDQTTGASPTAGDFQNGGTPRNVKSGTPFVDDVFGSWSTANVSNGNYTVTAPPAKNDWTLGSGSDAPVGTTFAAMGDEGYGAEVRWNVNELTDSTGQPLKAGDTYRFQVIEHDGDQNKTGGDAGEFCVTLKIPKPPTPTLVTNATSTTLGGSITDTATLSGGNNPTGTLTWNLYDWSDTNCKAAPIKTFTQTVTGDGNYTTPPYTPASAGVYRWIASYSGDGNNSSTAGSCNDPNEESTVPQPPAGPRLVTHATSGPVGSPVTDTATLSGGNNPTGTITWNLYSDSGCTQMVYTVSATVNGNRDYTTSPGFTTNTPGTYYWVASYSGDANNQKVASGCSDANEQSTVWVIGITTNATSSAIVGDTIVDSATLTGGSNPTGTITWHLYSDSACSNLVDTASVPVNGTGTYAVSPGYKTTAPGSYYWVATYSGDSQNAAVSTKCGDPNEVTPVNNPPFRGRPGIRVLKLASVRCADLYKKVTPPATCAGKYTHYTRGILTLLVPHSGGYALPIKYLIRVRNTGQTPLKLSLSDPLCDPRTIRGPFKVSGTLIGKTLSAGGAAYYTCSHKLTQTDPRLRAPGQPFTNVAVVTGQPPSGPPVHGRSTVTVHRFHTTPGPPVCRNLKTGRPIHYRPGHKPAACKPQGPQNPRGFTG